MTAAGAYLWALRESQGISRDELAAKAGTNGVQIMRIEKGEIDTRGSLLASVIWVLRANADHVMRLIRDDDATVADGRDLAYEWLSSRDMQALDAIPDNRRHEVVSILDDLDRRDHETFQAALRVLKALVGR